MRIVQENAAPAARIRVPVPDSPRAARLNASVICVTGSMATKSRSGGAYTTRNPAARSAAIVDAERPSRIRERRARRSSRRRHCRSWSSRRARAGARGAMRRDRDEADRQLRRVVLPEGLARRNSSVVVADRGKKGWKPSPNGNGASPVLASASLASSVAPLRSADSANDCVARNGHGHARASAPVAVCSSASSALAAVAASTRHGRCQPTPWIACGWSPKLRASSMARPAVARRASAIRFE